MPPLARNTDAPSHALGVRLQFNPRGQAKASQDRRLSGRYHLMIVASMQDSHNHLAHSDTLAPLANQDKPQTVTGVQDVIEKCGTRSGCRYIYEYVRSAVPSGLRISVVPVKMSGSKATFRIKIIGTAQGSGRLRAYILDYLSFVDVKALDTASTIAAGLITSIHQLERIPYTAAFTPVDILTGVANAGIRLTVKVGGVTIRLINPGVLTASTTVAVTNRAIEVTLKHDGTNITATSNDVIAALIASASAKELLATVGTAPGHDGAGTPTALAATALAGDEIVLTAITGGEHTSEHPVVVDMDDTIRLETSAGVRGGVAAGSILFAGGNTGAAATFTTTVGTKSAPASLGNAQAEALSASQVASGIQQTGSMTCDAIVDASTPAKVWLLYKKGEVFNAASVAVSTSIAPQTATLDVGVAGSGVPTLTSALNNLISYDAAQEWVNEFGMQADDTPLQDLSTHLRTFGDGYRQKEQFLTFGYSSRLTAAGASVTGITPTVIFEDPLKASPGRFLACWAPDFRQRAIAVAAMRAALRCAQARPTKNFDGMPLISNFPGSAPLNFPSINVRPDDDTTGQARQNYFLTPIVIRDDIMVVESDVTTYGGAIANWRDSPYSHGAANYRQEVLAELKARFFNPGVEVVDKSPPRVDGVIDPIVAITNTIHSVNKRLEQQNLFDGADFVKPQIDVQEDPDDVGGYIIYAPFRLPKPLHKITGQLAPAS